jgi:hypothetical protein
LSNRKHLGSNPATHNIASKLSIFELHNLSSRTKSFILDLWRSGSACDSSLFGTSTRSSVQIGSGSLEVMGREPCDITFCILSHLQGMHCFLLFEVSDSSDNNLPTLLYQRSASVDGSLLSISCPSSTNNSVEKR